MNENETLYDKAMTNYNAAVTLYQSGLSDDETYLNLAAYHLQQSVELAIKYLLECAGVDYPYTHNIAQLIQIGNKENVDLYLTEYIDDHAEMFTEWESKTRYVLGYLTERRKIEKAFPQVEDFLKNIEKHCFF